MGEWPNGYHSPSGRTPRGCALPSATEGPGFNPGVGVVDMARPSMQSFVPFLYKYGDNKDIEVEHHKPINSVPRARAQVPQRQE
jgi:hypothetical protein